MQIGGHREWDNIVNMAKRDESGGEELNTKYEWELERSKKGESTTVTVIFKAAT